MSKWIRCYQESNINQC